MAAAATVTIGGVNMDSINIGFKTTFKWWVKPMLHALQLASYAGLTVSREKLVGIIVGRGLNMKIDGK
jgi:hypothetical protein